MDKLKPEMLLGKDVTLVVDKLKELKLEYRTVRKDGLITADFRPDRLTIEYDENLIVTDCAYG